MRNRLREAFTRAVDAVTTDYGDVADGISRDYRMVQAYLRGERRVTADAARRMVTYLRRRARELEEAADKLEAAVNREEEE